MRSPILLIATAALFAACSSSERTNASATPLGGTLIIAPAADANDIFPVFVTDATGRQASDQIYDHLAVISPNLETIGDKGFSPRLASKWTWAPDSLSIAFSLDPRARWHDGKPVTARDVKYSFWAFTDSVVGSPVRPLLGNVDSVSIRDSLTPVFWFKKRAPGQFYDVAFQIIVVPEHVYGSIPAKDLRSASLRLPYVGTGRFRFVKWEPGVRLEIVADTNNFLGRARLDRVIFAPAEPAAAAEQILSGHADVMEFFPVGRVPELEKSTMARPLIAPTAGYAYFGMNPFARKSTTKPHAIFSDRRVRRAMSMAVDRVAMLKNVFDTTGKLSHGPFPMTVSYADSTIRLPAFDTAGAKALLDSAGWRTGPTGIRSKGGVPLRFNMVVPSSSVPRQRYAVLMQESFRKIGAQADVDVLDGPTAYAHQRSGDFDAILASFAPDPGVSGTIQIWGTAGIGGVGQNALRYSNPKVDALLDSATATFDTAKVRDYSSRAFHLVVDDVPAIFLYDLATVYGVNRRVTVAPFRLDAWWANLADWSIPVDKRIDRDRVGLGRAAR